MNQVKNDDSDDDLPQLSACALAALQEFCDEEKQRQEKLAKEGNTDIEEDWVGCILNNMYYHVTF